MGRVNGTIEKARILWREVAAAPGKKEKIFAFKKKREGKEESHRKSFGEARLYLEWRDSSRIRSCFRELVGAIV